MNEATWADRPVGAPTPTAAGPSSRAGRRQVVVRVAVLAAGFAYWVVLALVCGAVHTGGSTVVTTDVGGHHTFVTVQARTLYEVNPGPVTAILAGTLVCLGVATASVAWRVSRRVTRMGAAGLVAAALVGTVALLGILTVGPLLVPLAVVLTVAALPMEKLGDAGRP